MEELKFDEAKMLRISFEDSFAPEIARDCVFTNMSMSHEKWIVVKKVNSDQLKIEPAGENKLFLRSNTSYDGFQYG